MPASGRNATPAHGGFPVNAAALRARLSGLRSMHDPESARGGPSAFGRLDARACVLPDRPTVAARRVEIPIEGEQT